MSTTAEPRIQLPSDAMRLPARTVAGRLGVSVATAESLLAEGKLIAFIYRNAPMSLHIAPASQYEVTADE